MNGASANYDFTAKKRHASRQERKEQQVEGEFLALTNEVAILVAEIQHQG
jgi:hypothetical protein